MDKIYTYRYMWKYVDSDKINIKIVSDVLSGLEAFEKALLSSELVPSVELLGREYLHEYDVSKIGVFETLRNDKKEDKE